MSSGLWLPPTLGCWHTSRQPSNMAPPPLPSPPPMAAWHPAMRLANNVTNNVELLLTGTTDPDPVVNGMTTEQERLASSLVQVSYSISRWAVAQQLINCTRLLNPGTYTRDQSLCRSGLHANI